VELDLVDAVAEAVVRLQLGRVVVRLEAPPDRLAAGDLADQLGLGAGPAAAFALERLDQRAVLGEEIQPLERGRLVGHRVGDQRLAGRCERHA
jgi:hypothetical protein